MRPLSGYSNCLCEALDAVALYGAAVYIRDATLRGCDTSEHCGSVAFAFRRRDGRLCEMALKQVHDQPLQKTQDDFSHRVVGTERTNKGQGASFQEASHHQRHTNPIPEKEGVHGPQRDLARRPTASQRAARARAVRSGREDGTASGRGLTRD